MTKLKFGTFIGALKLRTNIAQCLHFEIWFHWYIQTVWNSDIKTGVTAQPSVFEIITTVSQCTSLLLSLLAPLFFTAMGHSDVKRRFRDLNDYVWMQNCHRDKWFPMQSAFHIVCRGVVTEWAGGIVMLVVQGYWTDQYFPSRTIEQIWEGRFPIGALAPSALLTVMCSTCPSFNPFLSTSWPPLYFFSPLPLSLLHIRLHPEILGNQV